MMEAIAIDDEPPALRIIEEFCAKTDLIKLTKTFTKPSDALKYLRSFPADLLFIDIQMPSLSGIEFINLLPRKMMFIFTTAHGQYAVDGFNLNAIDFLKKPFSYQRFLQALNKAHDYFKLILQKETADIQYIFIRADYSLMKIACRDIHYIEGLDDFLKIHIMNQKTIVARMTMKVLLEKLPAVEFIRVHRSFIVPLSKIQSVRNKNIILPDVVIPIGEKYRKNFFQFFKG
ncbi:MAG TPA: LytTR family DNA-binding domain-containing protein [Bacteroidia bacterium]|nr:LytTR family DNA-binding domain-containing protein [Bacteroidia bacterium]